MRGKQSRTEGLAPAFTPLGMSAFVEGEDQCVLDVFSRADYLMYTHKNEYKASIAREERT